MFFFKLELFIISKYENIQLRNINGLPDFGLGNGMQNTLSRCGLLSCQYGLNWFDMDMEQ